ncbi:MAG: V-type ATP synthase subunit F [Promethearchaeota archaeon]
MVVVVIADEETCVGFKLIGIETVEVGPDTDFQHEVDTLLEREDIAVLIIGEDAFLKNSEYILDKKAVLRKPLMVPIPDIFGERLGDYMERKLQQWIGAF